VSGYPRKYAIHLRAHHRWRPLSPAGGERGSVLSGRKKDAHLGK
jgi:hypothetical protein